LGAKGRNENGWEETAAGGVISQTTEGGGVEMAQLRTRPFAEKKKINVLC